MVLQAWNGISSYIQLHTHNMSNKDEHLIQNLIFSVQQRFYYCQRGYLDFSVYYTSWYLLPVLLMGHLLSRSIPVVKLSLSVELHRMIIGVQTFSQKTHIIHCHMVWQFGPTIGPQDQDSLAQPPLSLCIWSLWLRWARMIN